MNRTCSTVSTQNVLNFVISQITPINFLEWPAVEIWASNGRLREGLIIDAVHAAGKLGLPFAYIKNRLCIMFFGEPKFVTDAQMKDYIARCMDQFGIPRHDKENILNNKN